MHFHPDKCNLISITQKRKPIHFTYKLHDHPLAKVEHSKYLGITLQSNLKWNKHINSITNKANQSLGFLKRNLKIKSSAVKSHAYKAFVRPKLEYASAQCWHVSAHRAETERQKYFLPGRQKYLSPLVSPLWAETA